MDMIWDTFIYYAIVAGLLWWLGAFAALKNKRKTMIMLTLAGLSVFGFYIILLWFSLNRPPLVTMGETRLWYAFFLPLVGLITYLRKGYVWIPLFSSLMATVFILVNLLQPEIHSQSLMPALQSIWFTPHVIIYMFAYAIMGATFLVALYLIFAKKELSAKDFEICDDLTSVGVSLLTLGMLIGAIWAKQAWGDYWTWDPKETWAAATWMLYLAYLHYRKSNKTASKSTLFILIIGFIFLQICWWGINILPSTSGMSIHAY